MLMEPLEDRLVLSLTVSLDPTGQLNIDGDENAQQIRLNVLSDTNELIISENSLPFTALPLSQVHEIIVNAQLGGSGRFINVVDPDSTLYSLAIPLHVNTGDGNDIVAVTNVDAEIEDFLPLQSAGVTLQLMESVATGMAMFGTELLVQDAQDVISRSQEVTSREQANWNIAFGEMTNSVESLMARAETMLTADLDTWLQDLDRLIDLSQSVLGGPAVDPIGPLPSRA